MFTFLLLSHFAVIPASGECVAPAVKAEDSKFSCTIEESAIGKLSWKVSGDRIHFHVMNTQNKGWIAFGPSISGVAPDTMMGASAVVSTSPPKAFILEGRKKPSTDDTSIDLSDAKTEKSEDGNLYLSVSMARSDLKGEWPKMHFVWAISQDDSDFEASTYHGGSGRRRITIDLEGSTDTTTNGTESTSTTEASTTEASTTEASTTEDTTTEASGNGGTSGSSTATTTDSKESTSTTEASTTEASTTEASTTEASTTEASTTEVTTTEASGNGGTSGTFEKCVAPAVKFTGSEFSCVTDLTKVGNLAWKVSGDRVHFRMTNKKNKGWLAFGPSASIAAESVMTEASAIVSTSPPTAFILKGAGKPSTNDPSMDVADAKSGTLDGGTRYLDMSIALSDLKGEWPNMHFVWAISSDDKDFKESNSHLGRGQAGRLTINFGDLKKPTGNTDSASPSPPPPGSSPPTSSTDSTTKGEKSKDTTSGDSTSSLASLYWGLSITMIILTIACLAGLGLWVWHRMKPSKKPRTSGVIRNNTDDLEKQSKRSKQNKQSKPSKPSSPSSPSKPSKPSEPSKASKASKPSKTSKSSKSSKGAIQRKTKASVATLKHE